jgi:dynein heavy chain
MNILTKEMRRSLKELDLGLKGELTITNDMEDLGNSLFFDQVKSQLVILIGNLFCFSLK